MKGLLKVLQSALRDTGNLDECRECGGYVNPASKTCPDCIEENQQNLPER